MVVLNATFANVKAFSTLMNFLKDDMPKDLLILMLSLSVLIPS
jgi:hypothetical protein